MTRPKAAPGTCPAPGAAFAFPVVRSAGAGPASCVGDRAGRPEPGPAFTACMAGGVRMLTGALSAGGFGRDAVPVFGLLALLSFLG